MKGNELTVNVVSHSTQINIAFDFQLKNKHTCNRYTFAFPSRMYQVAFEVE